MQTASFFFFFLEVKLSKNVNILEQPENTLRVHHLGGSLERLSFTRKELFSGAERYFYLPEISDVFIHS